MAIDPASLTCKCGCGDPTTVTQQLLGTLDMMEALGCVINPTCGVRCSAHNASVGGAPDSRHLPIHRDAADLACNDSSERFLLVKGAIAAGASFIEVCQKHIHIDLRGAPRRLVIGAAG